MDDWLVVSDVLFLIQPTARPRTHPPPVPGVNDGVDVGVSAGVSGEGDDPTDSDLMGDSSSAAPLAPYQEQCLISPFLLKSFVSTYAVQPAHFPVDPWDPLNKSTITHNHPSIHPFSTAYPGSGCGGSSLRREAQTSLSPATPLAHPEGSPGVPRPVERHSLSNVSWVFPGSPTGGTCPEHLTREASRGHPN
ncbi:hypothetical protein D4764_13G0000990 [Takifugu flavidus]|uniref:Uncharacterized protein n=1 Tax=Takifugu flavidus TaxID=433684 RepID=A0A5C6PBB2_9TELE|nr:hypothetical protein D4764_13G0000990 [Takifugu flavidus]